MEEKCPICGATSKLRFLPYKIPYFGDAMMFISVCPSCGHRSTDVMLLSGDRGSRRRRYEVEISSVDDLNIRVVRSSFGRIEIPELGVNVEPRRGEGFITTVEGVLKRVEDAVRMLSRDVNDAGKKRAKQVLMQIDDIKAGNASMKLIIDDPTGNSAILSKKKIKIINHRLHRLTQIDDKNQQTRTVKLK